MTVTYVVQGMTCGHCEKAIDGALRAHPAVEDVRVDRAGSRVEVRWRDEASADDAAVEAAVDEEGFAFGGRVAG